MRLTDAPLVFASPSQGQAPPPRLLAAASSWPSGAAPAASSRLAVAARPTLG